MRMLCTPLLHTSNSFIQATKTIIHWTCLEILGLYMVISGTQYTQGNTRLKTTYILSEFLLVMVKFGYWPVGEFKARHSSPGLAQKPLRKTHPMKTFIFFILSDLYGMYLYTTLFQLTPVRLLGLGDVGKVVKVVRNQIRLSYDWCYRSLVL